MANPSRGKLVILSGPSGVGKTTLRKRVFERARVPLVASVSATTRAARPGEVDDVDYHFLTEEAFADRRRRGEFLECCQVFGGKSWYGTLRDEVTTSLAAGKWVVLEIDVQGAAAVAAQFPQAITIFVRPSSPEVLEQRLRGRATEEEETLRRRLEVARSELARADQYRYQVVNDDLEEAVEEICNILANNQDAPLPLPRAPRSGRRERGDFGNT